MAIPGTTSALIAAFAFGIVVNAASAVLFLNVKGHGSSIFRDGKRLVLVTFLLSSALWAQIDFITTLIDPTATQSCRVGVIFTTIFDQLARFSIEQHLLWVVTEGMSVTTPQYILQALAAARLVLGGAFVALSKPEFNTVCVPVSSMLVLAIVTVVVDAVIIVGLAGQAFAAGLFAKMQDGGPASARGKAVVTVLAGLVIWMGTSVPMSLGVVGSDYLTRSTIPAGGLTILIIIVGAMSDSLVAPDLKRDQERRLPEAPSPRMIATGRSISTSASNDYPPSRYEDLKAEQLSSVTAFVQPREVPQPGQPVGTTQLAQNLPTISNAVAGQGVGGLPVQGTLFPPLRANTDPPKPFAARQAPQEQPRRAFFDSSKGLARSVTVGGRLAISNPVLQQGGSNPLDKVATTDLTTAAQMDRQRREMMALYNDSLAAPVELSADPERGLMQSTTTIRKEIAAAVSQPLLPDSANVSTGSATGAQLSPSGDELRRRSPRQASPDAYANEVPSSSVALQSESRTPPLPLKSPGRGIVSLVTAPGPNPIIRPSRQRPPSLEPVIEPLKTPLQRRPTAGLPMNPRSRSVRRPSPPEAGRNRQETVLFVNDIVYNDPTFVASVMDDAQERGVKPALPSVVMPEIETAQDRTLLIPQLTPLPEPPATASSIVHRPRPIPRRPSHGDGDTFYPPTGHKKSRSLGNLMQGKSILQSNPGSPRTLPPLPPPPLSAKKERPQPNDTKSMTYSEKVSFLFPALQSAGRSKRRSSLPDMQNSFTNDSPTLTDNDARDMHDRDSKRTMTSVRTQSIFSEQDRATQRNVSGATYRGLVNEAELQQKSPNEQDSGPIANKRASSPILPIFGDLRSASTVDFEDDMTNFGTVYSPQHVQQVGLAVHQARAIEVLRPDRATPDDRGVSAMTNGEEMTIMLDTSVAREIQQVQAHFASNSPVDDGSPVEGTTSTRSSGPWHRRVGEETLSFSGHSDNRGSKRGPPPTPLALSDRPTQAKQIAIAQAAELSPLPSPEEALKVIQAQLKKYEQADRASVESPGRQALLNDLEAEMGQQETRWLGMQNRFTQDSITTLDISPTAESRRTSAVIADVPVEQSLSRNSSTRSNMASDRSAYRRTRQASFASSIMSLVNDDDNMPFGSRASLWQRRLAAAQQEFIHTASELDRKRSRNFLALSSNLGSPTPPDSDESETEIESRRNLAALLARQAKEDKAKKQAAADSLWTAPKPQDEQIGLLWVRPEKPYHVPVAEPPLPGLSIRPAQRKEVSTLTVASDQLWQKAVSDSPSSVSKLWFTSTVVEEPEQLPITESAPQPETRNFYNPGIRRSQTVSGRPLTQRPPRRGRRITALPDIVEDPVPLPDKRDTLGIFQFPWGEKSDLPSVPQRSAFTAMPGTMSTGGARASYESRSRELEQAEYSSSFFDEYEEDDDSDSMGSESDDGFDETTLFEIASLLKANNVPSTNSFFGSSRDSLLDQYMTDEQRNYGAQAEEQRKLAAREEEAEGLQMMPQPSPPQIVQSLWEDDSSDEEETRGSHGQGLPQPEDWARYDETTETVRAKPRLSQQPASVDSDQLWAYRPLDVKTSKSPMWISSDSSEKETSPGASASSSPLWQAQEQPQRGHHGVGLPHPQNWANYDGVQLTARTKTRQAEPAVIESVNLWVASEPESPLVPDAIWIMRSESAPVTRPASPDAGQVMDATRLLWSAPVSPQQMSGDGLFSSDSGRTDYKTTAQTPAAVQMERKARPVASQTLDSLASTTLWVSTTANEASRNWLSVNVRPTFNKRLLWSAPASPKEVTGPGLFDAKSIRSDFRTTSQAPAALEGNRKARSPEMRSLDQLTSDALWVSVAQAATEKNWLSLKASSPLRLLWSAPASPKAVPGSKLFAKSTRTDLKTSSMPPAAIGIDRKYRTKNEKALDQLTSTSLWVPNNNAESERDWISSATASGASTPNISRGISTPQSWQKALDDAVAASYPVASTKASGRSTRVERVAPEQWLEALDQAIAASYPIRQIAARKEPLQATPSDWAAALAEAVVKSYNAAMPFDTSRRHPVFAASSMMSTASVVHPAAIGYTFDVAAVHPVFFGSGAGEPVHPALTSSRTNYMSLSDVDSAPDEVHDQPAVRASVATKARGSRITAMASMFEDANQDVPPQRSFSLSRQSSMNQAVTPPQPATPEPQAEEAAEKYSSALEYEMDPVLLAQIEALEQERLFAEQWVAGSFEPTDDTPWAPNNQLFEADALLEGKSSPPTATTESPAPVLLEAKTYEAPASPLKQQASPAVGLDEQIFMPKDITPQKPLAPLTASDSKPETAAAQPTTPKSVGWFSSISARLGGKSPGSPPAASPPPQMEQQQAQLPQISHLQRSNTVTSTVSALSESDTITLRDSLISVDSERGKRVTGSRIQFRY